MTHVNASYTQTRVRGRNDDGSETTATWKALENTNWTQDVDVNFRVRFQIDETAGGGSNFRGDLQYNLNGAGYVAVTGSSSVVRSTATANFTEGDPTTAQLTAAPGTFIAGQCDEVDGITTNIAFAGGEYTEIEYSVQIIGADVSDADTIQLRLVDNGTAIASYTFIPSITVNKETTPLEWTLAHYRWGDEDDASSVDSPTWLADEDTALTGVSQNDKLRLYLVFQKTAAASSNELIDLFARVDGGSYFDVTNVSSDVIGAASGSMTNEGSISPLPSGLTAGSGSFVAGRISEGDGDAGHTGGWDFTAAAEYTVACFVIQVTGTSGTLDFKPTDGGVDFTTYSVTPSLTLGAAEITGTATLTQDANTISASGGVAIDGTASLAQDAQTISSAGAVEISGSAALTQDAQTVSASGTVGSTTIEGTASLTQADHTVSASGAVTIDGTATLTQEAQTAAASGAVDVVATASLMQDDHTVTASGGLIIEGAASLTQDNQTVSSVSTVEIAGALSVAQDGQTAAAAGTVDVVATLAVTQDDHTITTSGGVDIDGSAALTQDGQTLTAAGSIGDNITGDLSVTQDSQTVTASGGVDIEASSSLTQDDQSATSAGAIDITAVLSVAQDDHVVTASGLIDIEATASITQDDHTASASGVVGDAPVEGTLTVTQDDQAVSAAGMVDVEGALSVGQAGQSASANGTVSITAVLTSTHDAQLLTAAGIIGAIMTIDDDRVHHEQARVRTHQEAARIRVHRVIKGD